MARFAASLTVKLLKSGLHVRLLHQGRSYRQSSRTGLDTTPRLFPPRLVLTRLANIMTLRDELGFILATVGIPTRAVAVTRRDPNADRRTNSLNCPAKEGSTSKAGSKAFSARQSAGKADRHPLPSTAPRGRRLPCLSDARSGGPTVRHLGRYRRGPAHPDCGRP
jgi:hypothetical protein